MDAPKDTARARATIWGRRSTVHRKTNTPATHKPLVWTVHTSTREDTKDTPIATKKHAREVFLNRAQVGNGRPCPSAWATRSSCVMRSNRHNYTRVAMESNCRRQWRNNLVEMHHPHSNTPAKKRWLTVRSRKTITRCCFSIEPYSQHDLAKLACV